MSVASFGEKLKREIELIMKGPGHAQDDLEIVLQTAIAQGMQSWSFTEHMPRNNDADLYPEEDSLAPLVPRHAAFLVEAVRLREKYGKQINILIGFEGEWIRPAYGPLILEMAAHPDVDYFIGSVHHVHEVPIDYDAALYAKAVAASSPPTEQGLFEAYYDSQHEMLLALKPRVVGHFDLIRLLASEPDRNPRDWPSVWAKIERNLKVVIEQGGLLEINSSGLRKGMKEPYPGSEIVKVFTEMGGKLTLSDDSHGVAQIGACFGGVVEFLERVGVERVWLLEGKKDVGVLEVVEVKVEDVKKSLRQ